VWSLYELEPEVDEYGRFELCVYEPPESCPQPSTESQWHLSQGFDLSSRAVEFSSGFVPLFAAFNV
jgi:hypothetical protein